tara:strand:- start:2236 stop:2478 length:243 start_codon:yes stop_codon:yes gene_type:complete
MPTAQEIREAAADKALKNSGLQSIMRQLTPAEKAKHKDALDRQQKKASSSKKSASTNLTEEEKKKLAADNKKSSLKRLAP